MCNPKQYNYALALQLQRNTQTLQPIINVLQFSSQEILAMKQFQRLLPHWDKLASAAKLALQCQNSIATYEKLFKTSVKFVQQDNEYTDALLTKTNKLSSKTLDFLLTETSDIVNSVKLSDDMTPSISEPLVEKAKSLFDLKRPITREEIANYIVVFISLLSLALSFSDHLSHKLTDEKDTITQQDFLDLKTSVDNLRDSINALNKNIVPNK